MVKEFEYLYRADNVEEFKRQWSHRPDILNIDTNSARYLIYLARTYYEDHITDSSYLFDVEFLNSLGEFGEEIITELQKGLFIENPGWKPAFSPDEGNEPSFDEDGKPLIWYGDWRGYKESVPLSNFNERYEEYL